MDPFKFLKQKELIYNRRRRRGRGVWKKRRERERGEEVEFM